MSLQTIIANRLKDGLVVYRGAQGWVDHLDQAELAENEAAAAALLDVAKRAVVANEVIDPYLIDLVEEGGALKPKRWRERIRSQGPTVRVDLGYQARLQSEKAA